MLTRVPAEVLPLLSGLDAATDLDEHRNFKDALKKEEFLKVRQKLFVRVKVWMDFAAANQLDSGINMILIFMVMLLLISFTYVLQQRIVNRIVLLPLEELLNSVRELAGTMFKSVLLVSWRKYSSWALLRKSVHSKKNFF